LNLLLQTDGTIFFVNFLSFIPGFSQSRHGIAFRPAAMTGKMKQKMGVAVGTAALAGVAYFTAIVMPSMAVPM
jgi:hypothetical protein